MTVIPDGYAEVVIQHALAGDAERMNTTMGISASAGTGVLDLLAAATDVVDEFYQNFYAGSPVNIVAGWTFLGGLVNINPAGGGGTVTVPIPRSVASTGPDASLPNNCAILVRKTTATAGRKYTGRMFIPPSILGEQFVGGNGVLTAPALTAKQSNVDGWLTACTAAGANFQLFHTDPLEAPTPILSLTVDDQIATQRRRMRP